MAKTSRKHRRAKARKGKGPAGKSANASARKARKQTKAKTAKKVPQNGKAAKSGPPKAKKAAPVKKAPKGKKKAAKKKAPAAKSPKDPAKSGFFTTLRSAFSTDSSAKTERPEPPRPTTPRTWHSEPDVDRFAALDPANRKKTKLPPIIERPSPLHLEEAPPRPTISEVANQRIRLENPVIEPRQGGQPIRLHPEDAAGGAEKPVKLTDALLSENVVQAMSGSTRPDTADPFVLGLDNDNDNDNDAGAKKKKKPPAKNRQAEA